MARQTNIKIVGTHGNIIYYKMYDDFYMRSRPEKNKQTQRTKQAATCFGLAQVAAGSFRTAFAGLMAGYMIFDNKNNLAQPVNKWILADGLNTTLQINSIPEITGYEFNSKSTIASRWKINLPMERMAGGLQLDIPAFNPVTKITAPADTKSVTIYIGAAGCDIKRKQLTGMYSTSLKMDYTDETIPARQLQLPVNTAAGNLTLVYVTLRYIVIKRNREKIVEEKAWWPGAIVSAMYN